MAEVIFETVHGSRLYGLDHDASDHDRFVVTDSPRTKVRHRKDGLEDVATVGIGRFLDLAMSGSHQSVEALFSPAKEWADTAAAERWRPLIEGARVGGADVLEKYERTIRKFCYGDFKRRQHAVRLYMNLWELRALQRIRFVRLTPLLAADCTRLAERYTGDVLALMLDVYEAREEVDVGLVPSG